MRTSLNETKQIDDRLFSLETPADALLFDAMLIIDPTLPGRMQWQKRAHGMVQQYSRKQLKIEIENAHQKLFKQPVHTSFKKKIMEFFKRS